MKLSFNEKNRSFLRFTVTIMEFVQMDHGIMENQSVTVNWKFIGLIIERNFCHHQNDK